MRSAYAAHAFVYTHLTERDWSFNCHCYFLSMHPFVSSSYSVGMHIERRRMRRIEAESKSGKERLRCTYTWSRQYQQQLDAAANCNWAQVEKKINTATRKGRERKKEGESALKCVKIFWLFVVSDHKTKHNREPEQQTRVCTQKCFAVIFSRSLFSLSTASGSHQVQLCTKESQSQISFYYFIRFWKSVERKTFLSNFWCVEAFTCSCSVI